MSEMVERVAKALWDLREKRLADIAATRGREYVRGTVVADMDEARAAIAAMRWSRENNVFSGLKNLPHIWTDDWNAIIDAFLAEGK